MPEATQVSSTAPVAGGAVAVALRNLSKSFGDVVAVDGVDLDIHDGEFFTLLGPSGSGKTTMLRMIAGFEVPTGGTIELNGSDVTRLAAVRARREHRLPGLRPLPAHAVGENVEYGLQGQQGRAQG